MRNRFLCLCLALVLALPLVLGACSSETVIDDEAAPVYTLYCITGDTTTEESIVSIEYKLNSTLFYRIGSIIKLEMVTADEYHELIESKMLEVSDYVNGTNLSGTNEKEEKQSLVNTAVLSENAKAAGYTAMSGEAILNDLEAGIDLELESPRLDLFLITDYNTYLELAENGDLAALDTVLSNEAKAIKSVVHSSFFNAAKVNNKTYGVPCNTSIGEYTYIVFDQEVLEESGVALETLKDLDDLEEFLSIVKENNPDVVPLANTVTPSEFSYMFNDGFAAYVNEGGNVRSTYEDSAANEYFTMLTRYSALGYFENESGEKGDAENVKFGVKFISGTQEEIEALAQANGYVYNQYSTPIATSENSIDCIYAVSALCPSSWQTDVMEILTELYTDEDLQNTFLYGVENENYRLEGGQVVRINQKYMMNYQHTGNCFIAYTDRDAGDSTNKWELMREQNIDAVESLTIGFTVSPTEYIIGTTIDEDGNEVEWVISEPNYEEILWSVIEPYYQKLMDGTAITFDYQEAYTQAEADALQSIYDSLYATYELRLQQSSTANIQNEVVAEYGEQFAADALEMIKLDAADQFQSSSRKKKLTNQLKEDYPDLSEEEIDSMVKDILEDPETLWEYRTLIRKESQWEDAIQAQYEVLINDMVTKKTNEVLTSADYLAKLAAIPESEKFIEDYNYSVEVEVADTVNTYLNATLSEMISEYCDTMIAECETALEVAITAFTEEYAEATQKAYEDGVYAQLKTLFPTKSEEELKTLTAEQMDFIKANAEATETTFDNHIKELTSKYYPDLNPDSEETGTEYKDKVSELIDIFDTVFLPLYEDAYNGKNLALYEIGYAAKDVLKSFGTVEEEETTDGETSGETEEETPVDPDEPVAGQYTSYYEFVIKAKFQTPYYDQFGLPS